ncbi:MAG: rubredoxin [Cetobacterium sp.]
MAKYMRCVICSYVYDELVGDIENGINPGTEWDEVPESWVCPVCYVGKDHFEEIE